MARNIYGLVKNGVIQYYLQDLEKYYTLYKMEFNEGSQTNRFIPLFKFRDAYSNLVTIEEILNREVDSKYAVYDFDQNLNKWNGFPSGDVYFSNDGFRVEFFHKKHDFLKVDENGGIDFRFDSYIELAQEESEEFTTQFFVIPKEISMMTLKDGDYDIADIDFGESGIHLNIHGVIVPENEGMKLHVRNLMNIIGSVNNKGNLCTVYNDRYYVILAEDQNGDSWSVMCDFIDDIEVRPDSYSRNILKDGEIYICKGIELFAGNVKLFNKIINREFIVTECIVIKYNKIELISRSLRVIEENFKRGTESDSEQCHLNPELNYNKSDLYKPTFICGILPVKLSEMKIMYQGKRIGYFKYDEDDFVNIRFSDENGIPYKFKEEYCFRSVGYDYEVDPEVCTDPNSRSLRVTIFDNAAVVHRVIDPTGQVWSMIVNTHMEGTDSKSIEFYKGDDLFNGDDKLYFDICDDNTDLESHEFVYDQLIPIYN